jgi:hypothetical protein
VERGNVHAVHTTYSMVKVAYIVLHTLYTTHHTKLTQLEHDTLYTHTHTVLITYSYPPSNRVLGGNNLKGTIPSSLASMTKMQCL